MDFDYVGCLVMPMVVWWVLAIFLFFPLHCEGLGFSCLTLVYSAGILLLKILKAWFEGVVRSVY